MTKFPFRKKQSGANDRHLQEELVNKYFDELDLRSVQNEAGDEVEFNADGVYSRINAALENTEKKNPGKLKNYLQILLKFLSFRPGQIDFPKFCNFLSVISFSN